MTHADFLRLLFPPGGLLQPTPDQDAILRHKQGPGWVVSGPGCGKTETLALLVLRLLYVEDDLVQAKRLRPEQILVTTFTEKAARNLRDRISRHHALAVSQRPELGAIAAAKVRVGALHRLCADILQECCAPNYRGVREMDEFDNSRFVYEHISIVSALSTGTDKSFWKHFANKLSVPDRQLPRGNLPGKWKMTATLVELFEKMTDDRVSIQKMRAAGREWNWLADLYEEYRTKLYAEDRCSTSDLQLRFLDFLETPLGHRFRDGAPDDEAAGIKWVLVDDYQDASPIQEEICFALANSPPGNIVVFGDEDEAHYGFRGRSGECIVRFDRACRVHLGLPSSNVARYALVANFRSDPLIVSFCNDYVTAFASMATPGARAPNRPSMVGHSATARNDRVVCQLRAGTMTDLAHRFAEAVSDLRAHRCVEDYNECCLLLNRTKEASKTVRKYLGALRSKGIPFYDARDKEILEQEEVRGLLGALIVLTDSDARHLPWRELAEIATACRGAYFRLAAAHPRLLQFVTNTTATIAGHPGAFLTANLRELVHHLLSLPPFKTWVDEPARRRRLARIRSLVERFSAMPVLKTPTPSPGRYVASTKPDDASDQSICAFYHSFLGYLSGADINEEVPEEVVTPQGMLPIMTTYQAKSLQFQFVFVGDMGEAPSVSVAHRLETEFASFRDAPEPSFARLPENARAELALIRKCFVAYSRARRGLILMGTDGQFARGNVPCGPSSGWLKDRVLRL